MRFENSNGDWEVIVVGGGMAGLSAAIYLGRARRKTLLIEHGKSMAVWEPHVENYLGFKSIAGEELLDRARQQAAQYDIEFVRDEITDAVHEEGRFVLHGNENTYRAQRVLLATGVFHIPPEIPHVSECLGHSMFFCKDCDGIRVQEKKIAIVGQGDDAVEYALGMLFYSPSVFIATNGKPIFWSKQHEEWLHEYEIPLYTERITDVEQSEGCITCLNFSDGKRVAVEALFTTRGDIFHNRLGKALGAELDREGQIYIDNCGRTSVRGLFAAGCVTPANCQMIIAAGQGATAAQTINRDLFEESLATHQLRRFRRKQLLTEETEPVVLTGSK